jgi:uncharacterized protein YbjT (DUF2867 family)
MDVIVHAGSATVQPLRYRATDLDGTRRLLEHAREAGVRHLAYISIVGMEGVKYPYYRWKLAAERVIADGPVAWTTLRATQFHTLMEFFLGGLALVPGLLAVPYRWRFQPVDAGEVAGRLAEIVEGEPRGLLPDFGGPEVRSFKGIAESWLRARRQGRRLVNLPLPFQFSREVAAGALLCPEHTDGSITWEQYLDRRYGTGQKTAQKT